MNTDRYAALSPAARLVAQAYGVVGPNALGVSRARKLLSTANVTLDGRRLGDIDIRRSNIEIIDAGLGVRSNSPGNNGVCVAPEWAARLLLIAREEGRLQRILSAFDAPGHTFVNRYLLDWQTQEMLWRCNAITGNFAQLDRLADGGHRTSNNWRWLAEPVAEEVLATLPGRHLEDALTGCLLHVIDTAAPPAPAIDACQRLSAQPEAHAAAVAFIRVLEGRFKAAEAVFADLPAATRQNKPATTALASTRAMLEMLRGDDTAARQFIDAAIAAEKAGTRKRKVFPEFRAFALSLLALVRIDTPECRALLGHLLETAMQRQVGFEAERSFVAHASYIQSGGRTPLFYSRTPCFGTLLDGVQSCWHGEFDARGFEQWRLVMGRYASRAAAHGLRWAAAESAAILRRVGQAQPELDPVALPDPQSIHLELGTRTLTVLAEPAAEWERSLKALEQLAYDAKTANARKRPAAAPVERRLVWQLCADQYNYGLDIRLAPREQRRNKNGTWSKGRKVALKRLFEQANTMSFLREQDVAAAAAIEVDHGWDGTRYSLGAGALFALAGHPHVFGEDGEPVEIVRREPELRVEAGADGIAVVIIEPHGWDAEGDYGMAQPAANRIEVCRFTASHQRLFDVVPPEGLEFPAQSKSRLLEAVSELASEVRVQSAAGSLANVTEVAADAEPWVRLEPFEAGLSAVLLVEPIANSDICFEPGQGGATVFATQDGERVQAQRDLAAERRAVAALLASCPRLASRPTEYAPLLLPDPVECLELLEQLKTAEVRCKWPKGEPLRIVARRSTSSLSLSVKSADEWLQASGKLAVDDRTVLDLKRLFELLDANPASRFLQLDSGEFLALTTALRRQLDDLASLSTPASKGAVRLHPLATFSLDDLFEEAEVDADAGLRRLRRDLEASRSFEPRLPSTLRAELRPYQVDGYRWLARLSRWGAGACLADDMGLGKTVQSLAVLLDRAPAGPALVVAPTSVVANWAEEARRFAPTLNVKVYTGAAQARVRLLDNPAPFDLYLTTYGLLQNDIGQLAQVPWHSAVLDEAQAIKNPATKRARAARQLAANFRVVTTGTPIQNNLMDLHSLFSFLNPGLLGSRDKFRLNFGEPVERDGDDEARARLRRIIAPFMLRRLKTEVLDDLPERTEITLHVALSPEEAALYEALRQRALEQLETVGEAPASGESERFQILAHLTRLRLACCNPKLVWDSPVGAPTSSKLATFAATLDELLQNRHKVLVFSQFVTHLKLVEQHLKEQRIAYQYLDGSTPAPVRSERIAAFQAGDGDVFLISLKAGGTGLNLTAADYVIHMDPWWNPAVEDQASDRAHRIGQTRPVTIYRLVAEGTIEEQIVDLHQRKRDLADRLLEGADAPGRLSTAELLELLRGL